ncbi:MAG: ROK family protein, partial [Mesorhizobium sp.]
MAKAAKKQAPDSERIVLAIDIGGSHVKILTSAGGEERRADSGPGLTPQQMIAAVQTLADGLPYDVVSIGYPGPVHHNRPLADPANLGKGWVGFDFATQFGKPVKLVNDALMQAVGSYEGGRMLFLGLGT